MVDLVKIRKKAKEKQETDENAASASAADEPEAVDATTESAPASEAGATKAKPSVSPDKPQKDEAPPPSPSPAKPASGKAAKPSAQSSEAKSRASRKAKVEDEHTDDPTTRPLAAGTERPVDNSPARSETAGPDEPDDASLDRLERFKREAGKRRHWVAGSSTGAAAAEEEEASRDLELLRFRLAGEEYAVDIEKIVEIVPPRATTRVPNAERSIVGIMSLRGTIVTVFDLRRKLGHPPIGQGHDADRRMIVVEREGETAGFLVDKVSRVVKLDPAELENHPVVSAAEQSEYVGGVFQSPDGLVILLDLEKIMTSQS